MVKAQKAIKFKCEEFDDIKFEEYTLERGWYEDRMVMQDHIICEFCGHDNHVIEEL